MLGDVRHGVEKEPSDPNQADQEQRDRHAGPGLLGWPRGSGVGRFGSLSQLGHSPQWPTCTNSLPQ